MDIREAIKPVLVLFLLDCYGEAFDVRYFCSESCQAMGRSELGSQPCAPGTSTDAIAGTVCDRCGTDLEVKE